MGFPVTILLVLLGLRFDFFLEIMIMLILMPFHLALSFWVTHSVFGEKIKNIADKKKYRIFTIPENRQRKKSAKTESKKKTTKP